MSRCYAYIVAYISRLEIGNVVLRPARLEVGHYDSRRELAAPLQLAISMVTYMSISTASTSTGTSQRWYR